MDTDLLRTFLTVARLGSFTAAAGELHLVQSTVTTRVHVLERELGTRLLDRSPAGAEITATGAEVVRHAQDVLDAEQRLRGVATPGAELRGTVVVGAPESICAYRLPHVVADLHRQHPGVTVHLVPGGTAATTRGVRERTLDLGVILDDSAPSPPLASTPLGSEEILLVTAPAHPAAGPEVTWTELAGYSYFLLEEGCSYSDAFLRELERESLDSRQVTRFGSIEAARACVVAGLGLSVLPRIACETAITRHELAVVAAAPRPDAPLTMVHDDRRWQSPQMSAVRQLLSTLVRSGTSTD